MRKGKEAQLANKAYEKDYLEILKNKRITLLSSANKMITLRKVKRTIAQKQRKTKIEKRSTHKHTREEKYTCKSRDEHGISKAILGPSKWSKNFLTFVLQ